MKNIMTIVMLFLASIVLSQTNNQSQLSLDDIMNGNEFIGEQPSGIFWSEDSKAIYFKWNPEQKPVNSLYKYELSSKNISEVSIEEERNLTGRTDYDYSNDKATKVFIKNGDVYLYDLNSNNSSILVSTFNDRESSVSFSNDETSILFERNDNLYRLNLSKGKIVQLTNFVSGSEKSEKIASEQNEWLENQQEELFEVIRDRKVLKGLNKEHRDALEINEPSKVYIDSKYLSNLTLTNSEKFVTYKLSEYPSNKKTMVPHFVSESGYTTEQSAYSKVGGKQATHELWMLDIAKDTVVNIDYSLLTGVYKKPAYLADYKENDMSDYKEPKPVNFFSPKVSPDGNSTVIEVRSMDNKDRWFAKIDFKNGKLIELNHQHDDAWIAGPGIPWQQSGGDWGWLDNETVWFHSENSGYSHLYVVNVNSKKEKTLTKGNWEVYTAKLAQEGKSMFIVTNEIHPGERQLYTLNLKNLKRTKLTSQTGNNEITISPDEKHFAVRQSFSNKPWELYLLENQSDAKEVQITKSTSPEFKSYDWRAADNIEFVAEDGTTVHARMYSPESGTEGKPMVVFVHGAGYLQNAHKWWSGYYREYMFHNYLVDNGYVVLDIDYRASKGYGRDFRTGIYRHMGGKDMSDQVDGVQHMISKYGVDNDRVGIYGGSYGGFITIMGMFNYPEVFQSGAAIRSVTDWAHYHHGYTANILNTPVSDPKAFERSSPINFAEGLKGHLLMLHGMVDDNVHFQDVVRLTQRLIELKKENWNNALYPVERHGFIESSSWADEYKRIYKLFEETLK